MTDLRAQLEKKRDELATRNAEIHAGEDSAKLDFKQGADAMLSLLWPVIEASEVSEAYLQGGKEWTYSEYEYVRDRLGEALTQLRRRVSK